MILQMIELAAALSLCAAGAWEIKINTEMVVEAGRALFRNRDDAAAAYVVENGLCGGLMSILFTAGGIMLAGQVVLDWNN